MEWHLNATLGYLGLGMPMDAWNKLEEVDAQDSARPEVFKLRVEVCCALAKANLTLLPR